MISKEQRRKACDVVNLFAPKLVLDCFAGSGTTAHAVLALNAADGGRRRFLLVEREPYAERLTAERVRRAAAELGAPADFGFWRAVGGENARRECPAPS